MDTAVGIEATDDYLVSRILVLNFASVHTTTLVLHPLSSQTLTQTYTHAIYDLAVHTKYHAELREEIESLVAEEGWKKSTVMKMRKLDSFLKESTRIHSLGQSNFPLSPFSPFNFVSRFQSSRTKTVHLLQRHHPPRRSIHPSSSRTNPPKRKHLPQRNRI
jgi:hypothetical protein